jgi:carboxyl-terminal processing protease
MSFISGRPAARALLALLVPALGACGILELTRGAPKDYQVGFASEMFSTGFEGISDYYIDPVSLSDFTTRGLGGLAKLEPKLKVNKAGQVVQLAYDSQSLASFPAPDDANPTGWGQLAAQAVEAGRKISPSLAKAPAEDLYRAVFDAGLSSLDRYSRYSGSEAAEDQRAGRDGYGGVGITLGFENEEVTVIGVMDGTPAQNAGMTVGDRLTHVDGQALAGLAQHEVVRQLRGRVDTEVTVTRIRKSGGSDNVTMRRSRIVPQTVTYRRMGDVAYFRLSGFNQHTARTLRQQVERAETEIGKGMAGIILDLRGNPGGLLDQAVAVSDLFIRDGEIVSVVGRHRASRQHFYAHGTAIEPTRPMVVLVDRRSASAAEIVAAAAQDSGRALVIGASSYGKGTVQTVIRMPNGGEITLTWARFHSPSGYSLQGLGVIPTICTGRLRGDPERVMDEIRRGVNQGITRALRMDAERQTADQRAALVRACPPGPDDDETDIATARRLLADTPTYARAVRQYVSGIASPAALAAQ